MNKNLELNWFAVGIHISFLVVALVDGNVGMGIYNTIFCLIHSLVIYSKYESNKENKGEIENDR